MDNSPLFPRKITRHLTFPLLAVTLLSSFGSSMLYGFNLAVVNSPAVHIKAFYNATWYQRYGHGLPQGPLTLMYSLTVSIFALGGFVGTFPVGILVTQYGRTTHKKITRDAYWPLFLSVVVVPAFLQLLLLNWFPESPRYLLIEKNNVHGAAEALSLFLGQHNVQDTIAEIEEEKRSLASVKAVSVWQLLSDHSVRLQVLSVVVINMGMQLSGIDAIWFYTNAIFENAGIPDPDIPYTTVGTGAIEVVAGLIGCFTIEKVGRRSLLIVGFCFMGICCAGITLSLVLQSSVSWMRYISVAFVIGIIAGFCMGPAGVPFLMTAELFKQSHRPSAYIVGGSLNWLSNFTVGFVFPFLQMSAGAFSYLVFCGICFLVALYVYFMIPETKNKTFMEISHLFTSSRATFFSNLPDSFKMTKLNGYGALENNSLEFSGSGSNLP
ncbi:hypothetical protein E2320_008709 [Naja naja]|nr:hypothetical protein E2320_008709 [Naja naja]